MSSPEAELLPSSNRAERRAAVRSERLSVAALERAARRARQRARPPAVALGSDSSVRATPRGSLPRVVRVDEETARLVLEPASRDLAGFGRFVLGEIRTLETGIGGLTRWHTMSAARGGPGAIGLSLPNFRFRLERYQKLRGDLLVWGLPGHGLDRAETDGEWYSYAHTVERRTLYGARKVKHVEHDRHSCARSRCEYDEAEGRRPEPGEIVCWRNWLERETAKATERISFAACATMRPEERVIHCVVSPRPIYLEDGRPVWLRHRTLSGYRGTREEPGVREEVQEFVRLVGLEGWLLIHHPFRISTGRWGPRHGCVDGDHYHFIGHGRPRKTPAGGWGDVCGSCGHSVDDHLGGSGACASGHIESDRRRGCRCAAMDRRFEGWFFRNLRVRTSVEGTVRYLLSHVGLSGRALPPGPVWLPPGESSGVRSPTLAVVWGGDWSTRSFKMPEPLEEGVPVRFCHTCKRLIPEFEWFRVINDGSGPPTHVPLEDTRGEWRAVMLDLYSRRPDADAEEDLFARRKSRHDDRAYWARIRYAQWVRDNWGRDGWFGEGS